MLSNNSQVGVARSGYFPQINASAGEEFRSSPLTDNIRAARSGYIFGATGTWAIWDMGATFGRVKQASAILEESKATLDDDVRQVELEVQQAYSNLYREGIRSKATAKNVEQATEALRLATARLDAGAGTQLEVLDARTQLTTAQSLRLQALYTYNAAVADFDRATATEVKYSACVDEPGTRRNCALLPSLRRRRSRHRFRSMVIAPRRRLRVPGRRSRARLQSSVLSIETFPALDRVGCIHGFVGRVSGIELSHDKAAVLENLDKVHRQARQILGLGDRKFITVRQVHGDKIARVDSVPAGDHCFEGCDGLISNQRDVCLGVYVADCCAVYLVDRDARAIGLVHSGKKGTALGVVRSAVDIDAARSLELTSGDLIAQLSPVHSAAALRD